jgi:hypothetical protein
VLPARWRAAATAFGRAVRASCRSFPRAGARGFILSPLRGWLGAGLGLSATGRFALLSVASRGRCYCKQRPPGFVVSTLRNMREEWGVHNGGGCRQFE